MLHLAVLVRKTTLGALAEHTAHDLAEPIPVSATEALVLLDAEVVARLLRLARPEDTRIDDVIMRLAV